MPSSKTRLQVGPNRPSVHSRHRLGSATAWDGRLLWCLLLVLMQLLVSQLGAVKALGAVRDGLHWHAAHAGLVALTACTCHLMQPAALSSNAEAAPLSSMHRVLHSRSATRPAQHAWIQW